MKRMNYRNVQGSRCLPDFISILFTVTASTKDRKLQNNPHSLSWVLLRHVLVEFYFLQSNSHEFLEHSDEVLRCSKWRLALNQVSWNWHVYFLCSFREDRNIVTVRTETRLRRGQKCGYGKDRNMVMERTETCLRHGQKYAYGKDRNVATERTETQLR